MFKVLSVIATAIFGEWFARLIKKHDKPKSDLEKLEAEVRDIRRLQAKYHASLRRVESLYAELVVTFGVQSAVALHMAQSVVDQTDLAQDMDRQVEEAICRLQREMLQAGPAQT